LGRAGTKSRPVGTELRLAGTELRFFVVEWKHAVQIATDQWI
jgi:hypothetical protein